MSESTLRTIEKNVSFLESIRPIKTSQYRATAHALIQKYASREISNIQTVTNLSSNWARRDPK